VEEEIKRDVQIFYKGKSVQQVNLIILQIVNSGNIPVIPTDYEIPISIDLGNEAQILTAQIVNTNPNNLRASINVETKRVSMSPMLFNPNDSISLKILATKFGKKITVDGRIAGVVKIQQLTEDSKISKVMTIGWFVTMLLGVSIQILGTITGLILATGPLLIALIAIGLSLLGISSWIDHRTRKRINKELKILKEQAN
jgi:hypothetical protein